MPKQQLTTDLWDFIENYSMEPSEETTARFFGLRERVRNSYAEPEKPRKKKPAREQVRDERGYYGKMVNYTTGPRMAYASFPDDGKPHRLSVAIKKLAQARARGEFAPVYDWLPEYHRHAVE